AVAGAAAVAVALALTLSACGGAGLSLARQACVHVQASLRLYARAQHTSDAHRAASYRLRAIEQLEVALPLAARATSDDPQWNPLMTTLQEIGRNSEANLVRALRAQCAQADTPNEQAPVVQSTIPGEPAAPTPSTLPGQ
ncbi:MAG: hypothetical protein ACRDZR_09865, partial [Acidimicrobiales bacterium]